MAQARAMPVGRSERALAVVAGVLCDDSGAVLIAQRAEHGREAGLWEFPGGKISVGESANAALIRELREELGLRVEQPQRLTVVRWRGPPQALNLHTFVCREWTGSAHAHVHQALRWVAPRELMRYPMPAPDRPVRARLALPRQYLITPEPAGNLDAFLARLERALQNPEIGIVSLRARNVDACLRARWAEKFIGRVRCLRPELITLLHGEPELALRLGFDGVHLSSRQLRGLSVRPLPESLWVFASCHDRGELSAAETLGVDAATFSPVHITASHPGASGTGWKTLAAATRATCLPCFALGGVGPEHLPRALSAGAHGLAGIRAYWDL